MNLTFVTSNKGKIEDVKRFLSIPMEYMLLDLDEIQSMDLTAIVAHKSKEAYKILHKPVLVEDTSIVFEALGNLPGPFIKWFYDSLNREGLCKLLDPFQRRNAQAISLFGYYDGSLLKTFEGKIYGEITASPSDISGFGWDSIFIPEGSTKVLAEMNIKEQSEFSIRKRALEKLKTFLKEID